MLLKHALTMAKEQLQTVTDEASPEAALLLEHATGFGRAKQLAYPDAVVTDAQIHHLKDLLQKRVSGIPLQYLIGEAGFMGLSFSVTPAVLIPRPETELLVELALSLMGVDTGQLATHRLAPRWERETVRMLDIGTGSGCIPVAIATAAMHAGRTVSATALDVSKAALAVARYNASRYLPVDRIQFLEKDIFSGFKPETPYDLIVSNPPYIPSVDIPGLMREVKDQEPLSALDGGVDGLLFYRLFAQNCIHWLSPQGVMLLEIGIHQEQAVENLFVAEGFQVRSFLDSHKIPRILVIAFSTV